MPLNPVSRRRNFGVLSHIAAFSSIVLISYWLRGISLQPDPVLQGYLQVITGLLAFVFAAVALVRFQGTQDRISLVLGVGFMVSAARCSPPPAFFSSSFCTMRR